MSKKKSRRKGNNSRPEGQNANNAPFGINPSQLMSMLGGNLDMNQIGNMLSNMKTDGLDLNNFNLGQNNKSSGTQMGMNNSMGNGMGNMMNNRGGFGGLDLGLFQNMLNNLGLNNSMGMMNNQNNNFGNNPNFNENINVNSDKDKDKDSNTKSKKKRNKDLNITNENEKQDYVEDENIEMLEAMKKIVEVDKIEFIERIIEAYNSGKI